MRKLTILFFCSTMLSFSGLLFADFSKENNVVPLNNAEKKSLENAAVENSTVNTKNYKQATEKFKKMSLEQRQAFTKEIKEKWEKLSEKEKQDFFEKVSDEVSIARKKVEERCAQIRKHHGEGFVFRQYVLEQLYEKNID